MAVYVDKAKNRFRQMVMCHLMADTPEELRRMADVIGLKPEWLQNAGTVKEHYDISLSKRRLALENGAVEIGNAETVCLLNRKRREACHKSIDTYGARYI